ncbi:PTS sugar transporter subunit IIB [Nocardia sp. NBC_00511]|uniref:PTS sugar transporter subunit IIB n=1 Tax=Nocardia sp. NBC_00511 TaxID=2903591 RepID=UPI0030E532B0
MITFTRVDQRGLIDQVVLKWINEPQYKADGYIVVDDEIAASESLTAVYKDAGGGASVYIYSESKALSKLSAAEESRKSYWVTVRSPSVLQRLGSQGADVLAQKQIVLGSTGKEPGAIQVTGPWHYTAEELKGDCPEFG